MTTLSFPYGKRSVEYTFGDELAGVLESGINEYDPGISGRELVKRALDCPVGEKLEDLAKGKKRVTLIASDHTRPVPSKLIVPEMLRRIRLASQDAEITILIATGCHRGTTKDELIDKFGEDIVKNEKIVIHDCADEARLRNIGTLPSGGECVVNTAALDCDLLVAEGFIEPHFFAGFSGGRKSVLPGIAGRRTVLANHCSEFIASEYTRTGILENNPIHGDMVWAAKRAGLVFVVNVALNAEKKVIYAVAGDTFKAHKAGTDFLVNKCGVKAIPSDIVISTNGGYPLDQNMYQSVKGMTAAEATVKKGGVIIMLSASEDGTGGDTFYHQLADEKDINKTMALFLSRGRNETVQDQWESQILLRILMKATVIYVSEMDDKTVSDMHMIPASSLDEAMKKAKKIVGKKDYTVTAIPDGISVIVR